MEENSISKVESLSPASKRANVLVKVLSVGDRKTIDSKYGGSRDLVEAVVGDETGTVIMSLWNDQIDRVGEGQVLSIDNGYITLVRGHMRLNVGKYGSFEESEEDIPDVNTEVDMSDREYESERRFDRGSRGSNFGGGGSYGGGDRDRRGPRRNQGRRRY